MPSALKALPRQHLQIRLLGELQVGRADALLELPASRKTRALLAYLTVTATRHLRSELCGLFWEDAADPRAGLRWSLTQLRRVLGERDSEIIRADRESVGLQVGRVDTDLARLARLTHTATGGIAGASREALTEASGLFCGEFLEGLDLPACYAYHEWCMAEREAASSRHEQILVALVERCRDRPEQALVHARALAAHNPLNERGHIELMLLLGALGRPRDALAQYHQCCRIYERELGLGPPAGLENARARLSLAREVRVDDEAPAAQGPFAVSARAHATFIGRDEEIAQFGECIERAKAGRETDVLLVSGVPGIGKSRLLDELGHRITDAGGRSLRGRAFEAEMVRPFGFWVDALRDLRDSDLSIAMREALQPLRQAGATRASAADRDSLFEGVSEALCHLAQAGPVAVLVDDLHWIEESSAALLHYVVRTLAGKAVQFVLTGRSGELEDNAAAQKLIAALTQSRRLRRIALGPLSDGEARALVGAVARGVDPERIVAQAQGNPLILFELARSLDATGASAGLMRRILETRLSRLSQGAGEMLDWAAVFGREFPLELLIAAHGIEPGVAARQLAELERHDLIGASGDDGCAFSHELIQQAAYSRISQPRRRLMHKTIATVLSQEMEARPQVCSEVAHHAGLGGQYQLAAEASVRAGEHGLRVFANREAAEAGRRGLRHAARIPGKAARARLDIALLRIQVLATSGRPFAWLRPTVDALMSSIEAARTSQLHAAVAQGWYLLSIVHQDAGDFDAAQQATLRAAQTTDTSDALGRARQLANSARCLVELGREVGRARTLVEEARTLAESAGLHEIEVRWCGGLLHRWDGHSDLALQEIEGAIDLATAAQDRWRQCKCIAAAAMIELEHRRPLQAIAHARALKLAASQLGEEADEPFAQAVDALARQMSGDETAPLGASIDAAIDGLRVADDKARLAFVLNLAATIQLERGGFEPAGAYAADALAVAEAIGEANESVLARATLAHVAFALGDPGRAGSEMAMLRPVLDSPGDFSTRAVRAVEAAMMGGVGLVAPPLQGGRVSRTLPNHRRP